MKTFRFIGIVAVFTTLMALLVSFHGAKQKEYEVNQTLRQTIRELNARIDDFSQRTNGNDKNPTPQEPSRELLRLRSEVTLLRRQQDDLLRQLATNAAARAVGPAS